MPFRLERHFLKYFIEIAKNAICFYCFTTIFSSPAWLRAATGVALAGATLALVSVVAALDLEQDFPAALDLQQAFVPVVVVPLTAVAFAPDAAADLEQAFPPALDLQQDLVPVAVLTVAAVADFDFVQAVLDFEQVFAPVVSAAAAALAAA